MSRAERRAAALELAAAAGAEVLVCADPANVHWLTGVPVAIETGPSPFAPPPVLVLAPQALPCLISASEEAPGEPPEDLEVLPYEGFGVGPLRGLQDARALVDARVEGRRVVGDSPLARGLLEAPPEYIDLAEGLRLARAIKDSAEVAAIRRALAVTDAGQEAAREAGSAGASEIEVLGFARGAMEALAGERLPLLADLLAGCRGRSGGGGPSAHRLAAGEVVLCDLAPRVGGTWGDSCAAFAVTEADDEARTAHGRVAAALERAIGAVRPGARAGDVDAVAREGLDYPHHTGHGIGSSYYEEPRVVPGARAELREGMVIALEPALYTDDFGIRLEHVVLVVPGGCEELSSHQLNL
ncbi:MAG: M24 family metallopeptidase [Solirubrobacterales bacterium]